MNIDFTQLIIAIIGVIISVMSALITKYVIPWLKRKNLEGVLSALVKVAYSIFSDGEGEKKFEYVINKASAKFSKWFSVQEIAEYTQAAYVEFCIEKGIAPSEITDANKEKISGENN